MKIECIQEKLAWAVGIAERVAGKHVTLPVLSCLQLDAKNNELIIRSTNLDLGLEITIPAKVEEDGIVAVPANILTSFISGASRTDKGVKITTKDANILVEASHSRGTIKTMPADDFPSIPKVSDGTSFTVNAADFVKGLKSVWYSASVSGIKPELSSVYIYSEDTTVIFAATDSFRLAEKRVKMKKNGEFGQILIPFKNIPEIIRIFEQVRDDISVAFNKNQISFEYKGIYLISRVIDGVFPDYKQIIPKQSTTEVVVLKQDLIDGLKVSHIFSDKFNQITIVVDPKAKEFSLKTKNADVGENTHNLDAAIEGDPITINFNYKYITDCFQSIESDSVSLLFNGLNRPLVIHPATDKSFTYLVMPMNR
jgi:DNA polymerase III subunit beta